MTTRRSARSLHVLAAGSVRDDSINQGRIDAAVEIAPPATRVTVLSIAMIRLYTLDVEQRGDPEPVLSSERAIQETDALLLATPECLHGMPGVLKGALDWASRPLGDSVGGMSIIAQLLEGLAALTRRVLRAMGGAV